MRKVVIRLVVTLIVLVVALVVADRAAVAYAQREAAQRLASRYDLPAEPSVKVEGFPFLTQVVGGHYDDIRMHAQGLTARGVPIDELHVRMRGVEAPLRDLMNGQLGSVRASAVEATAVVSLSRIRGRLPEGLTVDARGESLRLSGQGVVLGRQVPVSALVKVSVEPHEVLFTATEIKVDGNTVNGPIADKLSERYSFSLALGEMPVGLRPKGAAITSEGLRITAVAKDVSLSAAGSSAGG